MSANTPRSLDQPNSKYEVQSATIPLLLETQMSEQSTTLPQPNLAERANLADDSSWDLCGLAESAMPDLVIGDLAPQDEDWVRGHTATCNYCSELLIGFEQVISSLDAADADRAKRSGSGPLPIAASALGMSVARYGFMESPVGDILLAVSDTGVAEISYLRENDRYDTLRELEERGFLVHERQVAVDPLADELGEYFQHLRSSFDYPVDLTGVTEFTRRVLDAAKEIPFGKVWTYGDVAMAIGQPRASRAVGNALGRNPVPVLIPCHRVILSSGAMGWYTGGPEIKRTLLRIEGVSWAHESQTPMALDL